MSSLLGGGLSERLAFVLSVDADGAIRGFQQVGATAERELGGADDRLNRVGTRMQVVGAGAVAFAGVAGQALWSLGNTASDLEQAVGGTTSVFGDATPIIDEFAKTAASGFGLSERAARELTSQLGAMLKGFGFTREEAAETSVSLSQLGADLSAAFGGSPEEAVQALGAALRGERDPIERYGVSISAAAVETKALELGLAASKTEIDANAKAQATLALIMEQTADVQGQFAREADTAAGQQARATAEWENLRAQLGEGVLPIMTTLLSTGRDVVGFLADLNESTGGAAGQFAAIGTAGIGAVGVISLVGGTVVKSADQIKGLADQVRSAGRSFGTLQGAIRGVSFVGAAAGVALLTARLNDNATAASRYAQEIAGGFSDPERQLANVRRELEELQSTAGKGVRFDAGPISFFSSDTAREAADRIDALTDLEADLELQLSLSADAAAEAAAAGNSYSDVVEHTTGRVEEATAAQQDLTKAMDDHVDSMLGSIDVMSDWEAGLDNLTDSVDEHGSSLDLGTEAGRRNHDMLRSVVDAGNARIQQLREQGKSEEEIRTAQDLMVLQLAGVVDQLGLNDTEAQIYIDTLASIPREITTTNRFEVDWASLSEAQRARTSLTNVISQIPAAARRATGGYLETGVPTAVNETGETEVLVNRGGGAVEVLTAGRARRGDQRPDRAAASSAPVQNHFHFPNFIGSPSDLRRQIDLAMRDVSLRTRSPGVR